MQFLDWYLLTEAFAAPDVRIIHPDNNGIRFVKHLITRHFGKWRNPRDASMANVMRFNLEDGRELNFIVSEDWYDEIEIPSVMVMFDWNHDAMDMTQVSDKEKSNYLVRKQLSNTTIQMMHVMRDFLKDLVGFSVMVVYHPIGKRRDSFYQGMLTSLGYEKVQEDDEAQQWIPTKAKKKLQAMSAAMS